MCEKKVDPGDAPVLGHSKLLCVCRTAARLNSSGLVLQGWEIQT